MHRIPVHTLETAPDESRSMLESVLNGPGSIGRILNLQAQLAHSPALLGAYLGMRRSIEQHATLDPKTRAAIQLTAGAVDGGEYSRAVASMLAQRAGETDEEIAALAVGDMPEDEKLAVLLAVVREATDLKGHVIDATWSNAIEAGWTDGELAEAFVLIALTLFVDSFVAFAGTELDVPVLPAAAKA